MTSEVHRRPQPQPATEAYPGPVPVRKAKPHGFDERYGPWAVVTGATEGIGLAVARELAARGLSLLLVARRHELLHPLCLQLTCEHGVVCQAISADLATADGCRRVIEATQGLDAGLFVAAAGFGSSGDFIANDIGPEREMLAVNCAAVLELSWVFARRFAERGRGGLVLLSSIVAFQGVGRVAHYAATKAWVQSLAEGLRLELQPLGVDVIASAPGPVHSGFARRAGLRYGIAVEAEDVARQTLDALGRRGTVRPGALSKLLGGSLASLPRWARVRLLSQIMAGMRAETPAAHACAQPGPT